MLRVGLTGNVGSGKSTVAALFAAKGAHVLASDAIGRELMVRGTAVFAGIVERFGDSVVGVDGELDRGVLARIAFAEGRVEDLNAIVHPAVIARQGEMADALEQRDPRGVLLIESALIFESRYFAEGRRFDRVLLVTATREDKIARFVRRTGLGVDEAERRLALQMPDEVKRGRVEDVIVNDGSLEHLETQVSRLWPVLVQAAG